MKTKQENEQRNTLIIWWTIILVLAFVGAFAQQVKRTPTGFEQVSTKDTDTTEQRTGQIFTDLKGIRYPVYQSKSGAFYVIHTSKKTGKIYRAYLKEVQ